ncbi:hypothetical protein AWB68_03882 [Caballeronia choica]|uniref:Uncharacterized protein n=2 Tax=Caballeronia choica TaxID=326476 RepID=A0A158JIQ4_9BURK|nr:hypothetical protein AWB68_03882 [Caballeronia choica]
MKHSTRLIPNTYMTVKWHAAIKRGKLQPAPWPAEGGRGAVPTTAILPACGFGRYAATLIADTWLS